MDALQDFGRSTRGTGNHQGQHYRMTACVRRLAWFLVASLCWSLVIYPFLLPLFMSSNSNQHQWFYWVGIPSLSLTTTEQHGTNDTVAYLEQQESDINNQSHATSKVIVMEQQDDKQQQQLSHQQAVVRFYQHHHEQMKRLINESTILNWETRQKPNSFRPLFDHFDETQTTTTTTTSRRPKNQRRVFLTGDICRSALRLQHPTYRPFAHVLFATPFDENWGQLSSRIPTKTSPHIPNLTQEWHRHGCTRDMIMAYFDHPMTLGVIVMQFQHDINHPKVHSIPLGIYGPQVSKIVEHMKQQQLELELVTINTTTATFNSNQSNRLVQQILYDHLSRPQILMMNNNPRPWRLDMLDRVQHQFQQYGMSVQNTYGNSLSNYYKELRRSKFILSPSGLGLDCYRHWEAIYFGTIPVLEHGNRTDGWFRTLGQLPVAWIDSYDNLTPLWLEQEYARIVQLHDDYQYQKLTKWYWIHLIQSLAADFLE